jgi:hypothetical protein
MGANAVTTVPVYTAGEVLTAANMNITNSGIPVFATTVTRDAAFGGAGEKTLAEGQFAYIEATNTTQYYDGAAWQSVGVTPGMVLVKSQTIGSAVSSVTVSDAFSATYDNYKIVVSGGVGSVSIENLNMTLGSTATGYFWARNGRTIADTDNSGASGGGGGVSWRAGGSSTTSLSMSMELFNPFLTDETLFNSYNMYVATNGSVFTTQGFLNNTTSYTAFTLTPASGTITGGTIRVYGYANS